MGGRHLERSDIRPGQLPEGLREAVLVAVCEGEVGRVTVQVALLGGPAGLNLKRLWTVFLERILQGSAMSRP